ncbi:MAG: glycosyltransferase family 39 protein [Bryobacterales bacterium]|nr:glycosyltransferase family 39 protein [Bryobacterales bacterium]MBV9397664.1 glycosyltransferase family 39 protein [Bryobacterales bacterium]
MKTIGAFAALALAVTILLLTSPYHADIWWSDASRHAMDGAFYRDLVRYHPIGHMRQFAMNYYLRYPALTILFYPPLFPVVEGMFFGIFGISLFTAQLTVSVFYLAAAWGVYVLCRRWMSPGPALAVSLLFIGCPEVAFWGRQVMLEIPVCAFLIWTAVAFVRYLEDRRPGLAYAVAVLLAGAAYTKQTSMFIVPALLWTGWRKFGPALFKDRHVWGSAGLFTALMVPLLIVNLKFGRLNAGSVVGGDWNGIPVFSWQGLSYYARQFPSQTNWAIVVLAVVALVAWVALGKGAEGDSFFAAWLAAGYAFFSFIALKEPRHTVLILLPLAFFAVRALTRFAPPAIVPILAVTFAVVSFGNTMLRHPPPYVDGYAKAAEYIAARAPRGSVVLFSGYRDGAFIFDLRRQLKRTDLWVLRADKLLLRVAVGRQLGVEQLRVSEAETEGMINELGVSYIVNQPNFWDDLSNMQQLQHVLHSSQFRKVATIPITSNVNHTDRELEIYENLMPIQINRKQRIRMELPIIGVQVEGTFDAFK